MKTLQVEFRRRGEEDGTDSADASLIVEPDDILNGEKTSAIVGEPFYLRAYSGKGDLKSITVRAVCGSIWKHKSNVPRTYKEKFTFVDETEKTLSRVPKETTGAPLTGTGITYGATLPPEPTVSFLCGSGDLLLTGAALISAEPVYGIASVEYQYAVNIYLVTADTVGDKLLIFSDGEEEIGYTVTFSTTDGDEEDDTDDELATPCGSLVLGDPDPMPTFYKGDFIYIKIFGKPSLKPAFMFVFGENSRYIDESREMVTEEVEVKNGRVEVSKPIFSRMRFYPNSPTITPGGAEYEEQTRKAYFKYLKEYSSIRGEITYEVTWRMYRIHVPTTTTDEKETAEWQIKDCAKSLTYELEIDTSVSSAYGEAFGTVVSASDPTVVLSGVKVTSTDFGTRITDADGFFSFGTKRAGTYLLSFEDTNNIYIDLEDAELIVVAGVTS